MIRHQVYFIQIIGIVKEVKEDSSKDTIYFIKDETYRYKETIYFSKDKT